MMFRRLSILLILIAAGLAIFTPVHAQEPTTIVDAALQDLSQKLGRPITRANVDTWTWEQTDFPDSSLGCPQPGQAYAQVVTRGYKITFTVKGVVYDYRATNDGKSVFQCIPGGVAPAGQATSAPTQSAATPAGQPATYQNPLAYIGANGNVYITDSNLSGAGTPITEDSTLETANMGYPTPTRSYGLFRWSPDGSKLAFVEQRANTLYLAVSGQKPIEIARGLAVLYPPAWSQDGSEIAYAVETNQQQEGDKVARQVQAINVASGQPGMPRVVGTFAQGVGCGGGPADPAVAAYMAEAGYEGNAQALVWTPQGFVHTINCFGVGIALTNPGGQMVWAIPFASRIAVAPDRARAVAIRQDPNSRTQQGIVMIDLSNGSAKDFVVNAASDQLAWSTDGQTIVYSTAVFKQAVKGDPQAATGQQLFAGMWPLEGNILDVGLWRVPAAGGDPTQIYKKEGHRIGAIAASSSQIVFSYIPSLAILVQQINNGASVSQALTFIPRPQLLAIQGQPNPISGGQPALGSGSFMAIPAVVAPVVQPTNAPGNVAPPNLTIGGQAVVSTTGNDPLNLRQSPTRAAKVLRILKQGAVVTILAGPQSAEGFRWWQVRADDGQVGWVVDQVTDETGTTNTLTPQ